MRGLPHHVPGSGAGPIGAICLAALLATPAQAVTYAFCWQGGAGYRIEGTISYPDGRTGLLTETDLTGFAIRGFRGPVQVGKWNLATAEADDPVTIRFDADALAFPMGGWRSSDTYQEWNAGGTADDCGNPGFGFNGGNRAQDVCVNGAFIDESGVPPDTPLAVAADPASPCGPAPMSARPNLRRPIG